ncbi:M20/M25/M40 family metallo-hydrolase [Aeromicrobium choanae]|uniref:Acetylornithine deacetylase/Succinyl-diaminopimelate desuccinylase n=1 Tax=Aeromicrobium choanae TaxID=1736691 RepID=A0A1T4Z8Z7_9ACTN|nr:M20/M25/M40 family metallo-hydrolase [Aeromicrobium choanae]SKB10454.1 Acetylornithine deacetylase/Succinyl-diaminopimelate desuccinylase [Aeromicrobium choanae]
MTAAENEVVDLCRDLIRIDTSNFGDSSGPGERVAAEYVAASLAEVGIESTILESETGRASVLARWGNQDSPRPGLVIHGHLDVVPAQAADWSVDPFAAEIVDDYVVGRGAVDMKDFDAILLAVVRERQRAGRIPDRPILLVFTADEEAGGQLGAHWLVAEHREWFEGCTEAIGEVGGFSTEVGGKRLYLLESGEKGIAWLRLTASGTAGHGSMRNHDNAITHLARALVRIGEHEWPVEPGPSMLLLLEKVRELTGLEGTPDELLEHFGPAVRMIGSGLRNSTNATMAQAGYKHNVVPGEAVAYVDGRPLPGHHETFVSRVQDIVGDGVRVEPYHEDIPLEYGFEGDLVDAMTVSLLKHDPEAHVAPFLMSGGTDAKAWHKLGMTSYGFTPLRLPGDLDFTALFHGVDERVPIDALQFGTRVFDEFLDLA